MKKLSKNEIYFEIVLKKGADDFDYFVKNIFSKSFDNFIYGDFIKEICNWTQANDRTMTVSARNHFKSTRMYALFMWLLLKNRYDPVDREGHYFSYKLSMAEYHVGSDRNKDNIKALIKRNIFFKDCIDMKPRASTQLVYSWDNFHKYTLTPHGLLSFNRGLHCNGVVIIDDALQDPAEKIEPKSIRKINDIFYTQIIDIPISDDVPMHIVGTAQTREDFYFDKRSKFEFAIKVLPGVKEVKYDDKGWIVGGKALFSEWRSFDKLVSMQQSRGQKTFSQEYMCNPVYLADAFLNRDKLITLVKGKSVYSYEIEGDESVIAGFDVGKHAHPSHLAIFRVENGHWKQLLSKWFDKVDYIDQVDYLNEAVDKYEIDYLYYDATRGELEALKEQGKLPPEMVPVNFNKSRKQSMATELEIVVNSDRIEFVEDDRQINQMMSVTNDLSAIENSQGHGDSFWSVALCFYGSLESSAELLIL